MTGTVGASTASICYELANPGIFPRGTGLDLTPWTIGFGQLKNFITAPPVAYSLSPIRAQIINFIILRTEKMITNFCIMETSVYNGGVVSPGFARWRYERQHAHWQSFHSECWAGSRGTDAHCLDPEQDAVQRLGQRRAPVQRRVCRSWRVDGGTSSPTLCRHSVAG